MENSQDDDLESRFEIGRLKLISDKYGMITKDRFSFYFGTEAIDLGPFCDPSEEKWQRALKPGDELLFSPGLKLDFLAGEIRLTKRVFIPETAKSKQIHLGVVLRTRHPASKEGGLAAFLCPPFGVVPLHLFAFGYDPVVSWPLAVGMRFWVEIVKELTEYGEIYRVRRVVEWDDDALFTSKTTEVKTTVPKFYRWHFEQHFNQTGHFTAQQAAPVFVAKEMRDVSTLTDESYSDDLKEKSNKSEENASQSALRLLQLILNDCNLLPSILSNYKEEFKVYYNERYKVYNERSVTPLVEEPDD